MRHHPPPAKHYTVRPLLAPPKWEEITTQWDFVDSPLGGAGAGLTGAVSPIPDVPSPLPAVGAGGRPAGRLGGAGRGCTDAGRVGPERVFQRCPFIVAKKTDGGATKRGKGTKLMAVADRQGLPGAVHTASAAPYEVTLVPATLARRLTAAQPHRLIGVGRKSGVVCLAAKLSPYPDPL